jgi:DNA-binding transcriptional LysR family regulator
VIFSKPGSLSLLFVQHTVQGHGDGEEKALVGDSAVGAAVASGVGVGFGPVSVAPARVAGGDLVVDVRHSPEVSRPTVHHAVHSVSTVCV